MIIFKKRTVLLSVCMAVLLSACSNENNTFDAKNFNQTAVFGSPEKQILLGDAIVPDGAFESYSGNRLPVELVKHNALKYIDLLYPSVAFDDAPYTQTSGGTSGEVSGLLKHQRAIIQATLAQTVTQPASSPDAAVYDFKQCIYKGTARQTSPLQQNLGNAKTNASYTFSDCQPFKKLSLNGNVLLSTIKPISSDGSLNLLSRSDNITTLEHTLSFTNLSINDGDSTYQYSGTIAVIEGQNRLASKANIQRINPNNNEQHYFKNLVWVDGAIDQLSGRIYDAVDGYVELSASDDLILDDDGIPRQGKLYLNGKDYAKVSIGKPKDSYYGSIQIELDEYGDGFNEFQMSKNVIYTDKAKFYAAR